MQEVLAGHALEEAWAANLEQQVCAWKAARSGRTSATEAGVLVVRRPRRGIGQGAMGHPQSIRAHYR
jgi:hypothetical protein